MVQAPKSPLLSLRRCNTGSAGSEEALKRIARLMVVRDETAYNFDVIREKSVTLV